MTGSLLRVPRGTPSSGLDFQQLIGPPSGFIAGDNCGPAVYYNGNTYFGFCDSNGNIKVAKYNHAASTVAVSPAIITGLTPDVHATPSVLVRSSDHKLVLASLLHNTAHAYIAISTNAEDVSAWGAATDIGTTLAGTAYTYAHLHQLSSESGKIYLFFRDTVSTTGSFAFSTSTDGGSTWSAETVLYTNSGKACYGASFSDDNSRIDFQVSDGNAGNGDTASVYHFYYTGGSYFKSDGTTISVSLPFGPSNLTKISDGATNGSVVDPYGIVGGANPIVVWSAYNTLGSAHPENYWYAKYSGGAWSPHTIDTTGSNPDPRFGDGGVAIDRIDPTQVYVSRQTGTYAWQLLLYQTNNAGASWTSTAITADTDVIDSLNLEPITPHNAAAGLRCLWCYGPHYAIAGTPSHEPPQTVIRGYPVLL